MTSTESHPATAGQTRRATEKSIEAWAVGAKTFTDGVTAVAHFPNVDLIQPVERYIKLVQQVIELNRDLANIWTGLVSSLYEGVQEESEKAALAVVDQAETVVDLSAKQAEKAAKEQAEAVEQMEKEQARLANKADQAAEREAKAKAREPYEGLPKAELSDRLAARGLPKTGTIEQLIERLVSADSE